MAVPKKRTGHSAQGHRRSNWKATKPEVTKCSKCGEIALTHTVCTACGYYKGKAVSIKSPDYVATTIEAKKPAKKDAKSKMQNAKGKTEEVEKTKKVEKTEEVVEEAKTEIAEEVKVEDSKSEE